MRIAMLIFSVFMVQLSANGQITPEKLGFRQHTLTDKSLGTIQYYVTSNKADQQKPVLLYLDGSGAYPLFQYTSRGIGSTVPIDYRALSNEFHVVLISKPGVPFIDSVAIDPANGYPVYPEPKEYTQRLSLDWRVQSANMVLQAINKEYPINKQKIAVIGISEGFQVGARLATVNKSITHLALVVGNGLSQFYDFILQNRSDALIGRITEQEAKKNIDSLYQVFMDIFAHPTATDKSWYGHTYLRWASFCMNNPTENLLSLRIPVYIVAASQDRNTSVLGTDYLFLESIRQKKNHFSYKVYPYDHSLSEEIKDNAGNIVGRRNHTQEVLAETIRWIKEHQ
jgi:hypothetical protein